MQALVFDHQKAVVFCQTLRLRDRSDLYKIARPANGQIGQPIVFRFAASCAYHYFPAGLPGEQISGFRFCDRPDLIDFQ